MHQRFYIGICWYNSLYPSLKAVEKTDPNEAVGVICRVDGKVKVVEYSELDQSLAEKRLPDGRLLFRTGNIVNHFFTLDFLKKGAFYFIKK